MPILDQVREHVETGLTDEALGRLIADAVEEVEGRWGTDAEQTVLMDGSGLRLLRLLRPALTITSVNEQRNSWSEELLLVAGEDYELRPGGRVLERIPGWGWSYWGQRVTIVYTPLPEISLRDRVVVDLVRLAVEYEGLTSVKVGDYSATHSDYLKERERLLAAVAFRRGLRFA
jgi:hypothetical protein